MTELVRIRPIADLHQPQLARIREFHARYRAAAADRIPSLNEIPIDQVTFDRILAGHFLGLEPTSCEIRHYGAALRLPGAARPEIGRCLGDLRLGPYLREIAREYASVRTLALPRFREVSGEVAGVRFRYLGGLWPTSSDGRRVDGIVAFSTPVAYSAASPEISSAGSVARPNSTRSPKRHQGDVLRVIR